MLASAPNSYGGASNAAVAGTAWRRALIATFATAAIIAIGLYAAFLALSFASLRTDRAVLIDRINTAFADKALDRQASWLQGNTEIGAHQYNDCLILFQAVDDRAPDGLRAISPLSVPVDTDNACATLADFAAGRVSPPTRYYHQYLHAHTTLARLLVPSLGVAGLRGLYKLAITLTLLAGVGYAVSGLMRGRRTAVDAAWLVIFLAFGRWFGLESFGQSLGHGPADLVALVFLLYLQRVSSVQPITPGKAIAASAVFGALTMQFEFLTGGLPLGLSIVVGALPLALSCGPDLLFVVVRSVLAYITAVTVTASVKLMLVSITFGPSVLMDLGHQFLFRTGLSHVAARDTPVGWAEFWNHAWAGLEALTPGMHSFAVGTLAISIMAAAWGYSRLRSAADSGGRLRAVALLGSMIVPPLWMVIFWQHTSEHAWFMDRILVWPIAAGGALFVFSLEANVVAAPSRR